MATLQSWPLQRQWRANFPKKDIPVGRGDVDPFAVDGKKTFYCSTAVVVLVDCEPFEFAAPGAEIARGGVAHNPPIGPVVSSSSRPPVGLCGFEEKKRK